MQNITHLNKEGRSPLAQYSQRYETRICEVINGEASFIEKCKLISEELSAYLSLFSVEGLDGSQFDRILQIIFLPILDISLHSISIRNIALRFLIQYCFSVDFEVVPSELYSILTFYVENKSYLNDLDIGYIKAIKTMIDNS